MRAGLGLTVQINHQAGTDHQIGLFFGLERGLGRLFSAGHVVAFHSVFGEPEFSTHHLMFSDGGEGRG